MQITINGWKKLLVKQRSQHAQVLIHQARALIQQNNIMMALYKLDEASLISILDQEVYQLASDILSRNKSHLQTIFELLRQPLFLIAIQAQKPSITKQQQRTKREIKETLLLLLEADKMYPNGLILTAWITKLQFYIGNFEKARQGCEKGKQLNKRYLEFCLIEFSIEFVQYNFEKALDCLESVLQILQDAPIWEEMGYLQNELGRYQEADMSFKRARQMTSSEDRLYEILRVEAQCSNRKAAKQAFLNEISKKEIDWADCRILRQLSLKDKNLQQAYNTCYEQLIKSKPIKYPNYAQICEEQLFCGENQDKIFKTIVWALKNYPLTSLLLTDCAKLLCNMKKVELAIQLCKQSINIQPNAQAYALLGVYSFESSKETCVTYLRAATKFPPTEFTLETICWSLKMLEPDQTAYYIEYLMSNLKPIIAHIGIWNKVGLALLLRQHINPLDFEKGIQIFHKVIKIDPNNLEALAMLACIHAVEDNLGQCFNFLQTILKIIKPQYEPVVKTQTNIIQKITETFRCIKELQNRLPQDRGEKIIPTLAANLHIKGASQLSIEFLKIVSQLQKNNKGQYIKSSLQRIQSYALCELQYSFQINCKLVQLDPQLRKRKIHHAWTFFDHLIEYLRIKPIDIRLIKMTRFAVLESNLFRSTQKDLKKLLSFKDCINPYSLFNFSVLFDIQLLHNRSQELLQQWLEFLNSLPSSSLKRNIFSEKIKQSILYYKDLSLGYSKNPYLTVAKSIKRELQLLCHFKITLLNQLLKKQENCLEQQNSFVFVHKSQDVNGQLSQRRSSSANIKKFICIQRNRLSRKRMHYSPFQVEFGHLHLQNCSTEGGYVCEDKENVNFLYRQAVGEANELFQDLFRHLQNSWVSSCQNRMTNNHMLSKEQQFLKLKALNAERKKKWQRFLIKNIRIIQQHIKAAQPETLQTMLQRLIANYCCSTDNFARQTLQFIINEQEPFTQVEQHQIFILSNRNDTFENHESSSNSQVMTDKILYLTIMKLLQGYQEIKKQTKKCNYNKLFQSQSSYQQTDYQQPSSFAFDLSIQNSSSKQNCIFSKQQGNYYTQCYTKYDLSNNIAKSVKLFFEDKQEIKTQFIQLQFKYQVHFARYLSSKKNLLKFIARHFYQEAKLVKDGHLSKTYMSYQLKTEMGEGPQLNVEELWKGDKQNILHWLICFVRGILQLQEAGLFHPDLAIRNTIKVAKNYYKIIDFDYAFKIEIAGKQSNRSLFHHTQKILKFWVKKQFSNTQFITEYLFNMRNLCQGSNYPLESVYSIKKSDKSQDDKITALLQIMKKYSLIYHRDQLRQILQDIFKDKLYNLDSKVTTQIQQKARSIDVNDRLQNKESYASLLALLKNCCIQCSNECVCHMP